MYSTMLILAGFSGIGGACFQLNRKKVPRQIIMFSVMLTSILGLYLAAGIGYISSGYTRIKFDSIGGVLGTIIGIFILARIVPQYAKELYTAYITVLPLVYGISKIGCHFEACCGGRLIHGKVFPVQLLEAVVFIFLFFIAVFLRQRSFFNPAYFAIICGLLKFLLDFLRDTHEVCVISFNQIACLVTMIIMGCIFAIDRKVLF